MSPLPSVKDVLAAAESYLRASDKVGAQLAKQDLAIKVAQLRAAAAGEGFDTVLREALEAMRELPTREQALGGVARGTSHSIAEAVEALVMPRLRLVRAVAEATTKESKP